MKVIIAVIKPFKIQEVTDALNELGVSGITIIEVRGHGRQRGHTEIYRGAEYRVEYIPKVRLELVAEDADVDQHRGDDRRERAHGHDRRRQVLGPAGGDGRAHPHR